MKTLFIALLVQVAVASPLSEVTTEHGTLTLEGNVKRGANANVRGSFRSPDGDGIRFLSTPDYLKIMTTDGENIVEVSSSPTRIQTYGSDGYIVYLQLLDKTYAEVDDHTYSLTESAAASAQSVLDPIQRAHLLARLQAEPMQTAAQAAVKESVKRVAAHPAVRLLEPAAQALGEDLGVTGMDHPAALRFYLTAMKITEARARNQEAEKASDTEPWRRYFGGAATSQAYPNCNLDTCPPCKEDECMGLCGRECSCWSWACNDCCLHEGCLEHDVCCRKKGFYTTKCLFPIGMTCNNYSC